MSAPRHEHDWASQAADGVDKVASLLRDKAVVPARKASIAVVYGILASSFVLLALVVLVILAFRVLSTYLPGGAWAAYLLLGGICIGAGVLCWSRRGPRLDVSDTPSS